MRLRTILVAALLALSVAGQPVRVAAQTPDDAGIERFDSRKFLDYAGCAVAIGFAAGSGAWLVAGLACYRVYIEYRTT